MSARSFFDTIVLVYADDKARTGEAATRPRRYSGAPPSGHRRRVTASFAGMFVTVTRKLHVDVRIARRKVELLAEFDVAAPEVADILAAIDLHPDSRIFFLGCTCGALR